MPELTTDITWEALTSPLSLRLALMALVLVAMAVVTASMLVRTGREARARRRQALLADEGGTATIEFALILPILLFVILTLTQVTFLMGGNLFVHYAAFAACRSAIVQIPTDDGDPANEINDGSAKFDAVHRAAIFAVLPVAGRGADTAGPVASTNVVGGLEEFYNAYGQTPPEWIQTRIAQQVAYAAEHTEITIERPVVQPGSVVIFEPESRFDPKDPVTVRVEHRLNLSMPYVSRIFADGDHDSGRYMTILARATLTNEGVRDDMPPPPELPRIY